MTKNELILPSKDELLETLEKRFKKFPQRHQNLQWEEILSLIEDKPESINSLAYLETSGGEPDVTEINKQLVYVDFSKESPKGRRSLCYDKDARVNRKKFPPASSVCEVCDQWQVELLTEDDYHALQEIQAVDLKTSSWLFTPDNIHQLGGAIFGDRRYDTTFIYHNGADSYYASRGFRAKLILK
ncbi:DUF4256 domain-containing protein [Ligilactobacillus salivarius]|uniref:DUF4256 domain-containing protein n=1 Tax=Ligilactobacillus salivarius TaxID=1624 RepID=UPI000E4A91F9|nr:DUF4256 domain-containing protein [Ligilactobacillus salivarius]MCR4913137.1 DUF4256 domain-containing protein [Lactobacillus sp.]RHJ60190.1 DUF4256 domain-containing protein [Ligilactobacillus salivarius]